MTTKLTKEDEQRIRIMVLNNQIVINRRESLKTAVSGGVSTITPPITSDWILADGTWNDNNFWRDAEFWND